MEKMENFYAKLGITSNSTPSQIDRALKRAAENQVITLEELQEAKKVLTNLEKKFEYDSKLKSFYPNLEAEEQEKIRLGEQKQKNNVRNKSEKRGCADFFALIGTGIVIASVFMLFKCNSSGSSSGPFDEFMAQVSCEKAVSSMLKAPSTAKFSNWQRIPNSDGTFTVSGVVDSQNSFGTVLRSSFSCTVRDKGNGNTGTVVNYFK